MTSKRHTRCLPNRKKPEGSESFKKASIEKKLLKLHTELIEAARQAGVTLPSH